MPPELPRTPKEMKASPNAYVSFVCQADVLRRRHFIATVSDSILGLARNSSGADSDVELAHVAVLASDPVDGQFASAAFYYF